MDINERCSRRCHVDGNTRGTHTIVAILVEVEMVVMNDGANSVVDVDRSVGGIYLAVRNSEKG